MKLTLLLLALWSGAATQASTIQSYLSNRSALSAMEKKQYMESQKSLLQALESDPLDPRLHLNLGMNLYAMEEPAKAAQAFASAAKVARTREEKFVALFNEAFCLGESKQIEKALEKYQEALGLNPESREVKVNIELLLAQQGQGQGDGQGDPSQNQQGQGKGQGQGQDQKEDQKDQQGQGQDQKQDQPQSQKKPQNFKSQDLSPSDVKKILEELKSQEQGIRAKEYDKAPKERTGGKDW